MAVQGNRVGIPGGRAAVIGDKSREKPLLRFGRSGKVRPVERSESQKILQIVGSES